MKNYYQVLGINKEADEESIETAFVTLLRKCSDEEFTVVEAAYRRLSQSQLKADYDEYFNEPEEARDICLQAIELIDAHRF
ncbi:MAG: DnaJ domain-containing protein [Clostridiales bacterium]|nr:DnaJ domain-containing protein [Clostridiales bacterium]